MNERFENAKLYLIDLLRAYGHRPVIVKVRMDGEPVEVMAKNMVKKQHGQETTDRSRYSFPLW